MDDIREVGGHGLVGDEGWRLTALRAAKEGESSPPSSGPGDDDWLAARDSTNPTNGGCSGNGERATSTHRGSLEGGEMGPEEEEALDAEFLGGWYSGGRAEDPQDPTYTWATTDASGLARIYWWMGGVTIMPLQRYWRGRAQARIVMAGRRMDNLPREWRRPPESVAGDVLRYLREYKRHSGVVPRATTWQLLMRGTRDSRGDDIGAAFQCEVCGENRRVGACHGVLVDAAVREGRASCEMVKGARCGQPTEQLGASRLHNEGTRAYEEGQKEDSAPHTPPSENNTGQGYSPQAIQFYRTSGKYLRPKKYKGDPSEVVLLSWKRGVERYFQTHGVTKENEKVGIGVDMLEGDAEAWWETVWMSGRDGRYSTWSELLDGLRERFLRPEGEMKSIGQWRRLQQMGSVASYADFVFRLKATCTLGEEAEFRLVFYGLREELQAEIRRQMRVAGETRMPLERLFRVAADAEVGLQGRLGRERRDGGKERLTAITEPNPEEEGEGVAALQGARKEPGARGASRPEGRGEDNTNTAPRRC